MQDLSAIAPGLTCDNGIWRARVHSAVDYPDEANAFCFEVEEGSFWFGHRNRAILEILCRFPPTGPIADVGAGNGFVSLALQRAGYPTLVIEPGAAGIRNARTRGLAPLICATLQDAGFRPGSLDAAGLFDVLEHIPDDRAFLQDLRAILKPGGRLYVSVPAFRALWSSEDDLVGHHHRYTRREIRDRLQGAGFHVDFASYIFSPLPLPLFLLRTLPSKLGYRQQLDATRTAAELHPPSGLVVRAITRLLDGELALLKRGRRIPFGTSCLVVATALP
jgi:SAM-dependent methyltransferase